MTVHLDHGSLPVASLLHLTITVAAKSGSLNGLTVTYGDGQQDSDGMVAATCVVPPPTPKPAPPSRVMRSFVMSYRVPALENLTVDANTSGLCAPAPHEHLVMHLNVRALPGPTLSNGPQLPGPMQVDAALPPSSSQKGVTYLEGFSSADPDGFFRMYVWDFGDGTRPVTDTRPFSDCHDNGKRWPTSTGPQPGYSRMSHHYAKHGSYLVRITVTSTGCTGRDRQVVHGQTQISSAA
jgi:hypothetical protein